MKILSRMLSKKIDPQKVDNLDEGAEREALDDAGRVNRSRDAAAQAPLAMPPEEPEVAGSGWAEDGDWDDDWDDDEEWGDDDAPEIDVAEHRRTTDKQHLVSEIREAMVSVSHVQPEEKVTAPVKKSTDNWSDDEEFGRRARARSQLTAAAAETEDRILEKTEDVMSDRETSRRRSAMAHMKAAAAATKADRVLSHVASRDPSTDPEEQSPYRDDLAKVVRPHSTSRPISRQVSRPNAPSPVWDQGAGDEDAALFAAAEDGIQEDPAVSVDHELSAAEEERLARTPAAMSEEDFASDAGPGPEAEDSGNSEPVALRAFPSSRFAVPEEDDEEEADFSRNAFGDFEDDDDDEDDFAGASFGKVDFGKGVAREAIDPDSDSDNDFAPQPSRVVSEAVAFANAPDDEPEEQPELEVRKKIWEVADEVAAQVQDARAAPVATPDASASAKAEAPTIEPIVEVATAVAGRAGRSAGRVKTRLLGFQSEEQGSGDVFATSAGKAASSSGSAGAVPDTPELFPAGWIVVTSGPGRGASFTLHNGVSQIGRGEDQTVRLDFGDTSISRNNHAAVAYDDEQGKFFLGHGGKSNLVRLNGMPVLSTEEMSDGDTIRIGETTLKFIALCGEEFTWSGNGDDAEHA